MPPIFKKCYVAPVRLMSRDDIGAQEWFTALCKAQSGEHVIHSWRECHSAAAHKVAYTQPARTNTRRRMSSTVPERTRKKSFGVIPMTLYTQHCNAISSQDGAARSKVSSIIHLKRTAQKVLTAITHLYNHATKKLIGDGMRGPRAREVKPKQCVERRCYQPRY